MGGLEDDFIFEDLEEEESKIDRVKRKLDFDAMEEDDILGVDKETGVRYGGEDKRFERRNPVNKGEVTGLPTAIEEQEFKEEKGTEENKVEKKEREVLEKMEKVLGMTLSEEQLAIIKHTGAPLNVLAGAGSGKTTVLVLKKLFMEMVHGEKPIHMLAITFSARARQEMEERYFGLRRQLKLPKQAMPTFRTFHALFLMLLQSMGKYDRVKVLDFNKYRNQLSSMVVAGEDNEKSRVLDEMFNFKGNLINKGLSKNGIEFADLHYEKSSVFKIDNYLRVMEKYEELKAYEGYIDFDDMQTILYEELIEKGNEEPVKAFQRVWGDGSVYIDEYQDISKIQRMIMDVLIKDFNRFTVIGDDDQCWEENTEVNTLQGIKKIRDITTNDVVETVVNGELVFRRVNYVTEKMKKKTMVVTTASGKKIETTKDHKFFATGIDLKEDQEYAYVSYEQNKGYKVGTTVCLSNTLQEIKKETEQIVKVWVLTGFSLVGKAEKFKRYLNKWYQQDGKLDGKSLLEDVGYRQDMPHVCVNDMNERNVYVVMNEYEGAGVEYYGLDRTIRETFKSYVEARKFAEKLCKDLEVDNVYERYLFRGGYLEVLPAIQLFEGMKIPVKDGNNVVLEEIVLIEESYGKKGVYHLEVEGTGILVAADVVTHNSIYSWRGSDPGYIIDFPYHYKQAVRLKLTVNYRCREEILNPILPSISKNQRRVEKDIRAFNSGGQVELLPIKNNIQPLIEALVEELDGYEGIMFKEIAVLVRQNSQRILVADGLIERGIPVNVTHENNSLQNNNFYKSVMDIIQMIKEKNNKLFIRHARKLAPQLGKSLVEKYNYVEETWYDDVCVRGMYHIQDEKVDLIRKIYKTNNMYNAVVYAWKLVSDYYKEITSKGFGSYARVVEIAKYVMTITRGKSIEEYERMEGIKRSRVRLWVGSEEAVRIDTLHSVKGLEYDTVYLVGMDGNMIPSMARYNEFIQEGNIQQAEDYIEEERRLFYVGWTRAKERLVVSYNKENPSMFLGELDLKYVEN